MSDDCKFITDASLGKLAKWLRLLGYDTIIFSGQTDREMLRLADAQYRIVLTRRHDMIMRQFSGNLHLVKKIDFAQQLKEIIKKYSLKIDKNIMFSRCLKCNDKLVQTDREKVRDLVPVFVFENSSYYNICPTCGNIYWAGTHQRNALQYLRENCILI